MEGSKLGSASEGVPVEGAGEGVPVKGCKLWSAGGGEQVREC